MVELIGNLPNNKNGAYHFEYFAPPDVTWIAVYNPKGSFLGNIHRETGGMYILAYQQKLDKFGLQRANEYMYGVMQGLAHALLYSRLYPKVEIVEDKKAGTKTLRVIGQDGTITEKAIPKDSLIVTPNSHLAEDAQ